MEGGTKHLTKSQTTIYTDGSKTKQGVGSGFVVYYKNQLIHSDHTTLPFHTTVFQAEIHAILKAGQYIKSSRANREYKFVKILSDSQAAVKALHNDRITSKVVHAAHEVWETLADDCPVVLAWIKAHVGHEGNELADRARFFKEMPKLATWSLLASSE